MDTIEQPQNPWTSLWKVAHEMVRIGVTEEQFADIPNYNTTRLRNVRLLRDQYNMSVSMLLCLEMPERLHALRTWIAAFDQHVDAHRAVLEQMSTAGDAYDTLRVHHATVRLATAIHQKRTAQDILRLTRALSQLLPGDMVCTISILPAQTWLDTYAHHDPMKIDPLDLESTPT